MRRHPWLRYIVAVTASLFFAVTGPVCALASPQGLSVIDGREVRSRVGGFEVSVPAKYQLSRRGEGSELNVNLAKLTGMSGAKVDFAATMMDQQKKSYLANLGIVLGNMEEVRSIFNLDGLEQGIAAYGLGGTYIEKDSKTLAGQPCEYIKINYGKLLADYTKAAIGGDINEAYIQKAEAYLSQLESSMVNEIYLCQRGGQIYVLCQYYSADMAPQAAEFMASLRPYEGIEGWNYSADMGWQYFNRDGSLAADTWVMDEQGLANHVDQAGQVQYNTWIEENGRWKYVDELGHMITSVTKTLGQTQYTFDAQGYLVEGSAEPKTEFEIGTLNGKTYQNKWADLNITFPEEATVKLGDGSPATYPLVGGEHVDYNDPELSYRITVNFLDANIRLDHYFGQLVSYGSSSGYKLDYAGPVMIGGHEYLACQSSYGFSDGTYHHNNTYIRQIDGTIIELTFNYFDELKAPAEGVFAGITEAK